MIESTVPRKQWWKIQWYSDDDTPEERKFIIKLDLLVVPYAVLAYWVKYIDQANLRSWYRGHETARRGGLFYTGLNLGTLTAGLVAAGASARLEGVNGLAGWRWMYIICALITFPVGILGYFLLPGTIDQPNRWVLNDKDIEVAKKRLERAGHVTHGTFKLGHLKKIFLSPQFWTVILVDVLFWNAGIHKSTGSFLLWIKSLQRYSPAKINELGTIAPALGILYNLVACFASDLILGPAWAITFASGFNVVGLIILVVWKVPEAALWFAFSTMYWSNALSSVFHGWVNTLLRDSPEERSFTLVMITIIAQSSTAWTPLLTFPTVEAPRYPKGFGFCLGCALALIASTHVLNIYIKRKSQPLHVLVTAITQRKVDEGKRLIQEVIGNAVSTPEWLNEHKKQQLRDLAMANGTFRDDEGHADARAQGSSACLVRFSPVSPPLDTPSAGPSIVSY
ncbi:transporter SEO1 like protein [Verticillium longisporum]|nr:transporter SEO1 like protein [Verticillium longisporum]